MFCGKWQLSVQVAFLYRGLVLSGVLLQALLPSMSQAQVTTSITSDGTLGTTVTHSDSVYNIMGGSRPGEGTNLFHSFDLFTIGVGDTANFLNTTEAPTNNILARVTGGQVSNIFGTVQTTNFSGANLFLMNPAGIVFGPTASLNVGGSVHFTTADYLRFSDSTLFTAVPRSSDALLTSASVDAFGFLGPNPAGITYNGTSDDGSSLAVAKGETLSLVGGDLKIVGDDLLNNSAQLISPSGQVNVASVGSAGEVLANTLELAPNINGESFKELGKIELMQGAFIDVSGDGGGTVVIRGGRLVIDNSLVFADTIGDLDGAPLGIDIEVAEDIIIRDSGITTDVNFGSGSAGDIRVVADTLHLIGTPNLLALIGSRSDPNPTGATGDTGNIEVSVGSLRIEGQVEVTTGTFSTGNAGDIEVKADSVFISGSPGFITGIFSNTFASGDAGRVHLTAGNVKLTNEASLASRTTSTGQGGSVNVIADNLEVSNGGFIRTTTSGAGSGAGAGGNISVIVGELSLSDGALITAKSTSAGLAGDIALTSNSSILIENSSVSASSNLADGGNIKLTAPGTIRLVDSQLTTSVGGGPSTVGGNINIDPQFVVLQNSQVVANAFQGQGGNIDITTQALLADPNSTISASSQFGVSGTVTVQSPTSNLSEALSPLPEGVLSAAALLRARCAAQKQEGNVSSFTEQGRDSLPIAPGAIVPSPLLLEGRSENTSTSTQLAQGQAGQEWNGRVTFEAMTQEDPGQYVLNDLAHVCSS